MAIKGDALLTPEQVAGRLGISRRALRLWVCRGKFPPGVRHTYKVVRWPESVVDEWIAAGRPERVGAGTEAVKAG